MLGGIKSIMGWCLRNWRIALPLFLVIIGLIGWSLGWFNYRFELSTLIGSFSPAGYSVVVPASQDNKLEKSIYDLPREFSGMSDLQAETKSKKYADRSVDEKGYFWNVTREYLAIKSSTTSPNVFVFCRFDKNLNADQKEQLLIFKEDDPINFSGVISRIDDRSVTPKHCEFK